MGWVRLGTREYAKDELNTKKQMELGELGGNAGRFEDSAFMYVILKYNIFN